MIATNVQKGFVLLDLGAIHLFISCKSKKKNLHVL